MRFITIVLAALLILIQYPLWFGKGGWLRVFDLSEQLEKVQAQNDDLRSQNAKMRSEVNSLTVGNEAIEERARYELSMIKNKEVFVQLLRQDQQPPVQGQSINVQSEQTEEQ